MPSTIHIIESELAAVAKLIQPLHDLMADAQAAIDEANDNFDLNLPENELELAAVHQRVGQLAVKAANSPAFTQLHREIERLYMSNSQRSGSIHTNRNARLKREAEDAEKKRREDAYEAAQKAAYEAETRAMRIRLGLGPDTGHATPAPTPRDVEAELEQSRVDARLRILG